MDKRKKKDKEKPPSRYSKVSTIVINEFGTDNWHWIYRQFLTHAITSCTYISTILIIILLALYAGAFGTLYDGLLYTFYFNTPITGEVTVVSQQSEEAQCYLNFDTCSLTDDAQPGN